MAAWREFWQMLERFAGLCRDPARQVLRPGESLENREPPIMAYMESSWGERLIEAAHAALSRPLEVTRTEGIPEQGIIVRDDTSDRRQVRFMWRNDARRSRLRLHVRSSLS